VKMDASQDVDVGPGVALADVFQSDHRESVARHSAF
jgi:hypothetical protein